MVEFLQIVGILWPRKWSFIQIHLLGNENRAGNRFMSLEEFSIRFSLSRQWKSSREQVSILRRI